MAAPESRPDAIAEAERRVAWCLRKGRDHLNLVGLGLYQLPADFARLTGLRYLDLTGNHLTALPDEVCDFADLRWLGLNGNALEELPAGISRLQNLERLYVRDNRLQRLPPDFGRLARLVELDLHNNRIANLPPTFLSLLDRPADHEPLFFDLSDNPGQVAVVAQQGAAALATYLRQIAATKAPVRAQGKLLLVGEGGVGKSTLLHALQGGDFVEKRSPTHGLKRGQVILGQDEDEVRLNCWDFSGQVEVRETHQIFFTAPAIYLLVWNARLGEHMARLEDWLWLIKHRTEGKARVLIVGTQASLHAELEAREAIAAEFGVGREAFGDPPRRPLLIAPGFLRVECNERDPRGQIGIDQLREVLLREVSTDETFRQETPGPWLRMQSDLEKGKIEDPFLSWTRFEAHCASQGIDDARMFARAQHRLGRLVWIERGELTHTVVLNPDWLSRAIGYVLHDPRGREAESGATDRATARLASGILSDARMRAIWLDPQVNDELGHPAPPCPEEAIGTFHRLMETFDLSHPVRGAAGEPQRLIPNRLSAEKPDAWDGGWNDESVALRRRVDLLGYDDQDLNEWLASAFLYRLMVRLHPDALGHDDYAKAAHWRHGFRIQRYYAGARIFRDGSRIFFEAQGTQPFAVWERVEMAIQSLAEELGRDFDYQIKRRIFVPCGRPCRRVTALRQYFEEAEIRQWATSAVPNERLDRVRCGHPDRSCKEILDVQELWSGTRIPADDLLAAIGRIERSTQRTETIVQRTESLAERTEEGIREVRADTTRILDQTAALWEAQVAFADRWAAQFHRLEESLAAGHVTEAIRGELTKFRAAIGAEIHRALDRLDSPSRAGPRLFSLLPLREGPFHRTLRLRLHCEVRLGPVARMQGTNGLGEFEIPVDTEKWSIVRPYVRGTARLLGWLLPVARVLAGDSTSFSMEGATDLVEQVDRHLDPAPIPPALRPNADRQDVLDWLHSELRRQTNYVDLSQASTRLGVRRVRDKAGEGKYLWVHPDEARNYPTEG